MLQQTTVIMFNAFPLKLGKLDESQLSCICDYVSYSEVDTVATGGKGDREIFVYKGNKAGKLTKLHCLRGHTGIKNVNKKLNVVLIYP